MYTHLNKLLNRNTVKILTVFAIIAVSSQGVHAQDWAAPAVGMVERFTSGLLTILKPLSVVGLIGYGAVASWIGKFNILVFMTIAAGVGLVFFGGDMLTNLAAG